MAAKSGIHEMSRVVGKLESAVEGISQHLMRQDRNSTKNRDEVHGKFDAMSANVQELKGDVRVVLQDVTEIKQVQATAQITLDDYKTSKPTAVEAIATLRAALQETQITVRRFEDTETRMQVVWKFIKGIGTVGWTIICGVGALGLSLFFYYLQRFL